MSFLGPLAGLWIVDERGDWNDDWQLDPAYRWVLGYGYDDQLDGEERSDFCDHVRKAFLTVLKSFASTKHILLYRLLVRVPPGKKLP